MNFAHPRVLWVGLALLPLLALFFWLTWRKRQELIAQFVQNKTLAQLALGVSVPRQKLRRIILFCGVAFLLLGMAGPQWGFTWEEAAQRGRDIIVAIDTSRSMLATDVQPDRLTRAKLAALDLLKLGKFDRFGLIAFAGTAFLQCPLTFDDEAFRQSVQILQPGIIPQGGTALGEAIRAARDAFGTDAEENHKILVLFTDGEDHEAGVKEAAERAAGDGVRIFTVGVGTPGGELLRVRDEQGNQVYVKDEAGNVVKSRLNEELLREVATVAKGFYLPLQGGNAMDVLYQRGLAPLPTSARNSKLMKQLKEQFYWPLGFGILLLVLELFIPEQKRAARKAPASAEPRPVPAAVAALLFLMLIPQARASAAQAERHYNAHEYKSALSEYQELIAKKPDDSRLHYNAGAAAYGATKFDEAVKQFEAAAASRDLDLQQQSFYNLGNSEFRVGEADSNPQQRTAVWEQAVQHYDAALKLNPQDKDAEFNRELVKKKLEELKKQQQQEKDKNQQNKDNKDEKKNDKQDQQNKDKQQQDNKSDQEKKQDQQNNESQQDKEDKRDQGKQQDKKQDQQQQQQQQQSGQDKQDQKKQDQANSQQGKESPEQGKPEGEDNTAQYAQLGKMSPAQAKQLLDAQRNEEKALLFIPQEKKANAQNHVFKDW